MLSLSDTLHHYNRTFYNRRSQQKSTIKIQLKLNILNIIKKFEKVTCNDKNKYKV